MAHSALQCLFTATVLAGISHASVSLAQPTNVDQLRSDTHLRLVTGHNPIGYRQTDEAMEEIHADPTLPGNLILFYTGRSQDKDIWVDSDGQNGWNREHLWPQSRGTRSFPMKSDLFHLMPTDVSVNQRRGNLNFDFGGIPEGEAPGTFLDDDSFEPRAEVKGDVARALFYMDVRYEGTHGEPDLMLVDALPSIDSNSVGNLCTLLAWHKSDPPSADERQRNDRTQSIQGNRNVFIDEPDLVDAIFGAGCETLANTGISMTLPASQSSSLRIGTWNIANLHHETGVSLRPNGVARDEEDYSRLAILAEALDLDVIALQEIGSPKAANRIFPSEKYHLVMSHAYQPGAEELPQDQRRIFTALAFSKDKFSVPPKTETFMALAVPHVGFDRDGTPSVRPTRAGMIAELSLAGEPIKIMGVHLKSFCHRWSLDPVVDQSPRDGRPFGSRFDCRTLKAQLSVLESWIEQQAAQGVTTIVLGDFNREMNAENSQQVPDDDFWQTLNDGSPSGLKLMKGPSGKDFICWPNHPNRHEGHIDFIVFDEGLRDLVTMDQPTKVSMGHESDPKYADKERQRLSDHCPVVLSLY